MKPSEKKQFGQGIPSKLADRYQAVRQREVRRKPFLVILTGTRKGSSEITGKQWDRHRDADTAKHMGSVVGADEGIKRPTFRSYYLLTT